MERQTKMSSSTKETPRRYFDSADHLPPEARNAAAQNLFRQAEEATAAGYKSKARYLNIRAVRLSLGHREET